MPNWAVPNIHTLKMSYINDLLGEGSETYSDDLRQFENSDRFLSRLPKDSEMVNQEFKPRTFSTKTD